MFAVTVRTLEITPIVIFAMVEDSESTLRTTPDWRRLRLMLAQLFLYVSKASKPRFDTIMQLLAFCSSVC